MLMRNLRLSCKFKNGRRLKTLLRCAAIQLVIIEKTVIPIHSRGREQFKKRYFIKRRNDFLSKLSFVSQVLVFSIII